MAPPRVRKCCVPGCLSREDQPPSRVFYQMPHTNKGRRRLWLRVINIQNPHDIKKRNMYVCEKHFEKKFIETDKKLRMRAYPTLFTQEEFEVGKSERYPTNMAGLAACDHMYWVGHYGFKSKTDHTYSSMPIIDHLYRLGATLIPDHTYSIPQVQQINNNINSLTADNNKENTVNNNSEDKQQEEINFEDKQKEEINFEDKETGENNSADKENRENNTVNKVKLENNEEKKNKKNTADKEKKENNSADKEKEENDSEEKKKEDKPKKPRKRKKYYPLGSAKRPIYLIHDNKENKTSNNNPNIPNVIVFDNTIRNDNSTDNDNNPNPNFVELNNGNNAVDNPKKSLANKSSGSTSSKRYKLLINNKVISGSVKSNYVADDGADDDDDDDDDGAVAPSSDNDVNDNVVESNVVIDLAEVPENIVDINVSADDNPLGDNPLDDNDEPPHDLVVDHTEVIDDIVQTNLNNEQILEGIVTEINRIESNLSDTIKTTNIVGGNKELTEKLHMNEMALINYNNTVVLCHKNDVAELKDNYPELVDQNDQIDQELVTKVKRHRFLRYRRKSRFKKQVIRTYPCFQNAESENEEAVRNIPCDCDANTHCEHRKKPSKIPSSRVLIFCDDCKEEHSVNYKFCKRNAPKPSPNKEIITNNKDNRKRYVTKEKFNQMTGNVQKLLQTSQQIQEQINSITTVLNSLVTAVTNIEREEKKKRKPRKPRTRRKQQVQETSTEADILSEQESSFVNKKIHEESVNLREKRHLHIEIHSQEQETLPENESLPVQETFRVNTSLRGSIKKTVNKSSRKVKYLPERERLRIFEYLPENIPSRSKKCLPEPQILPVNATLPETRLLRGSYQKTINNPLDGNKELPKREILPVNAILPDTRLLRGSNQKTTNNPLYGNKELPKRVLPVNGTLPETRHLQGSNQETDGNKELPEREILPETRHLQGSNQETDGNKELPEREILPVTRHLRESNQETAKKPLDGNKELPEREILPVRGTLSTEDFLPGNRGLLEKQYLLANGRLCYTYVKPML